MAARKRTAKVVAGEAKREFERESRKIRANLLKVREKLLAKEKQAREYIRKNPRKAVAMAAAVGALAGVLVTLIAKRRKKVV